MEVICSDCKYFSRTFYDDGKGGLCSRFPKWELVKESHHCGEFSTKRLRKKVAGCAYIIDQLVALIKNPPKHDFWSAGEKDCPRDIKARNGEIHTFRCKTCGLDNVTDEPCFGDVSADLRAIIDNAAEPRTKG